MVKGIILTRFFAITGTVLAGIPILLTVVTSVVGTISAGIFLFDYLMPAELFLVALAGGLLLLWIAFRTRLFRKSIIVGLAGICVFLAASQLIALVSGLASGAIEPTGFIGTLVIAFIGLYTLAVIELAAVGAAMARRIFRQPKL